MAEFTHNAVVVETLSGLDWEAFLVPGTDKGDTTLNAAVFNQQSKFNDTAKVFQNDTAKLVDAAEGGNFDAIKSQFGEVAKNCKSCHQAFRVR